ncbi:uncharacterized protein ACLA_019710 [Aspergillus clavatus NRRL 1]|uniref:Uncharacterized protein n=1 Tax=Aspergillus clavatus (strain ATCC 1007 / CBS 513.65 / DSM 816 / NCTC 3887 / NRRL 1 / QM 1276 / 107) TaxID=344612 RepID=A1CNP5_ASPCL|nr:uncharacterized protein ACLA_019710 [Aspergillus clavatus NRRL 1]EAW07266.1 conserved hypothetical protein [Aspergillus clavatus NRRL 1]
MRKYRKNQRNQPNNFGQPVGFPEHLGGRFNERVPSVPMQDMDRFPRDPRLPILPPDLAAASFHRPRLSAFSNQSYSHPHVQQQNGNSWLPGPIMTGRHPVNQTSTTVVAPALAQMREQEEQCRLFLDRFRSPGPQQEYEAPAYSANFPNDAVPKMQKPIVTDKEVMFAGSRYPNSQLRGDAPEFVPGKPFLGNDQKPKSDRGWMVVTSW